MTPYYADDHLAIWQGDCREVLAAMPSESVHTVVTSPPYWGLRDYGTATWEGGDPECNHRAPDEAGATGKPTAGQREHAGRFAGLACWRCGAVRIDAQLGLEPTPEEYVANMVAVFREVRRVLRNDGTVWLNLGDSYAAERGGTHQPAETLAGGRHGKTVDGERVNRGRADTYSPTRNASAIGLKHKDLCGIPWRVAFALQADGWYLRSDIIWSKPNPMPESVTDRPTKAHEYLFLLSKAPRYYYDAEAVREDGAGRLDLGRMKRPEARLGEGGKWANDGGFRDETGRNLRSVWSIATEPYPGAHFATFPQRLVEPCVKAGSSERGVCPECGAPWVRETKVEYVKSPVHGAGSVVGRHYETGANNFDGAGMPRLNKSVETTGWHPTCKHDAEPVPATVLDPFGGTGTVGLVAQRLGRRAVLIDLNAEYLSQCLSRNRQVPLGLVG